ncbi:MAG TPA: hypothetical protein DCS17_00685 [Flavobacterium sp.]|nr:hypothetical protein [Flavobacterium sp.]
MKKQTKIALITCWYGNYPWYFPYYVHSCSFNPTIDFYIITDNLDEIPNKPDNLIIVYKTLEEIKETASEKLGFTVCIENPYKLCDFKPAYGFLFPEIVQGYDFWGHGDIDVVYGNIRNFMTDEVLKNHDVISSRHDYITGSFCLFRNNEFMNTLFKKSIHYEFVFRNPMNFCFDECNYLFGELQNGASIFDFPDRIQSMTYVVKNEEKKKNLKAYFDFIIIEGNPGEIEWIEGKIIYKKEFEALFYHLIKLKTSCINKTVLNPIPKSIFFTTDDILSKQE